LSLYLSLTVIIIITLAFTGLQDTSRVGVNCRAIHAICSGRLKFHCK